MARLNRLHCKRCDHRWVARIPRPAVCPKCHTPYWNKEKVVVVVSKKEGYKK